MMSHLIILPILIPMAGGAAALFVEHNRFAHGARRLVAWGALLALLIAVVAVFIETADGQVRVYLLGDWSARLGIALMADRLSAWMLLTTALLAVACLLHACNGQDRRAPHFHALFQFQLMGINGAFLTGDIFNLFVFFEVLLIASYGLLLSGGRGPRLGAGLHYVSFNIATATLFLIALGLLYGQLGTLNMAELAVRIDAQPAANLPLLKATLGLLLLVFCSKAALLPLYLWLPDTYAQAPAAVAALFAVLTKVGLYALLRLSALWFGQGQLAGFGAPALLWAALASLLLAALGVLAARRFRVLIAYLVVFSAATLLVAFTLGRPGTLAAGLYYLPHSTFVAAALFMIAGRSGMRRAIGGDGAQPGTPLPSSPLTGLLFLLAAVAVAGLPPLPGFLAKAALLAQVPAPWRVAVWSSLLGGGLLILVGLCRAGMALFWTAPPEGAKASARRAPARPLETAATLLLLGYLVAMSLAAEPLFSRAEAIARQLRDSEGYVQQVRAALPQRRLP